MSQDVLNRTDDSARTDRPADSHADADDVRFALQPGEPMGRDLLKNRFVSAVMRSRW